MIDQSVNTKLRREFAIILRALVVGNITNNEFERRCNELDERHKKRDVAVDRIFSDAWICYCDLRTHRLRGIWALSPEAQRYFARCLLFLRTDQPYTWPRFTSPDWLTRLFGQRVRLRKHAFDVVEADRSVYPFRTITDLESAGRYAHLLGT